jgi:hypothetical protein
MEELEKDLADNRNRLYEALAKYEKMYNDPSGVIFEERLSRLHKLLENES